MNPVHEEDKNRFTLNVEGAESVLEYTRGGDLVVFTHTYVPPQLRGKGIAETLVKAGLNWVKENKLKADSQCSYVTMFMQRHPEYTR